MRSLRLADLAGITASTGALLFNQSDGSTVSQRHPPLRFFVGVFALPNGMVWRGWLSRSTLTGVAGTGSRDSGGKARS